MDFNLGGTFVWGYVEWNQGGSKVDVGLFLKFSTTENIKQAKLTISLELCVYCIFNALFIVINLNVQYWLFIFYFYIQSYINHLNRCLQIKLCSKTFSLGFPRGAHAWKSWEPLLYNIPWKVWSDGDRGLQDSSLVSVCSPNGFPNGEFPLYHKWIEHDLQCGLTVVQKWQLLQSWADNILKIN